MKQLKLLASVLMAVIAVSAVASVPAEASGPPVNTSLPTILGKAQYGGSLLAFPGSWTNEPTFTYQWQRCNSGGLECLNIPGSKNTSYTVASGDMGHTIVLKVTAHNAFGEGTASSKATALLPTVKIPEISPAPTEAKSVNFTATSGPIFFQGSGNIECTSSKATGAFVNPTEAIHVEISFSGCTSFIESFHTERLKGTLGYVNEATHTVALKLFPETGNVWAKGFYGGSPLEGLVFGALTPVNTSTNFFTLTYKQTSGVQEIQKFQNSAESNHSLNFIEKPWGMEGAMSITTASKVEIKA